MRIHTIVLLTLLWLLVSLLTIACAAPAAPASGRLRLGHLRRRHRLIAPPAHKQHPGHRRHPGQINPHRLRHLNRGARRIRTTNACPYSTSRTMGSIPSSMPTRIRCPHLHWTATPRPMPWDDVIYATAGCPRPRRYGSRIMSMPLKGGLVSRKRGCRCTWTQLPPPLPRKIMYFCA